MKTPWLLLAVIMMSSVALAEDLKLPNGKVLKSYSVFKVEPDGLRIVHADGLAKVPFEDLPAEMRKQYNYDPDKAQVYRVQTDATRRAAMLEEQRRTDEEQERQLAAAEREKNTPRLTEAASVKGHWIRSLPKPVGLDPNYSRKIKFANYMTAQIRRGDLDLEAEQTALQWNIKELQRVGQHDQAKVLMENLDKVRLAIEDREARRQAAELEARRLELEEAQLKSQQDMINTLQMIAFQMMAGRQDVIYWEIIR